MNHMWVVRELISLFFFIFSNFRTVTFINGVAFSILIFQSFFMMPIDFYLRWLVVDIRVKEYWLAIKPPIVAVLVMLVILIPLYYVLAPVNHALVKLVVLVLTAVIVYVGMIWLLDSPLMIEVWGYLKPPHSPEA